jgi:hypothetical protein
MQRMAAGCPQSNGHVGGPQQEAIRKIHNGPDDARYQVFVSTGAACKLKKAGAGFLFMNIAPKVGALKRRDG